MSDDQISLPYLAAILVVSGLIIRYLFFSGPPVTRTTRSPEALMRSREAAVERIQQMFPQAERRSILWDLQRSGGNIQNTTERILAGRLETVGTAVLVAHICEWRLAWPRRKRRETEADKSYVVSATRDLPAGPSAGAGSVKLELCAGDEAAGEAVAAGPNLAVQPQGQDWHRARIAGGGGGGQGQEGQGLELEPGRAAGGAAAEAGRHDSSCTAQDGGQDGGGEGEGCAG